MFQQTACVTVTLTTTLHSCKQQLAFGQHLQLTKSFLYPAKSHLSSDMMTRQMSYQIPNVSDHHFALSTSSIMFCPPRMVPQSSIQETKLLFVALLFCEVLNLIMNLTVSVLLMQFSFFLPFWSCNCTFTFLTSQFHNILKMLMNLILVGRYKRLAQK